MDHGGRIIALRELRALFRRGELKDMLVKAQTLTVLTVQRFCGQSVN